MLVPLILRWPQREAAHEKLIAELAADQILGDEPVPGSVNRGLWPGVRSAPKRTGDSDVTSASREPWVDANGYLAAYERTLHPERPALLGHAHKNAEVGVPFDTLELALVEARVHGGNFILPVEPRYRAALLAGDAKAKEAWRALGRTAAWLRQHESLFGRPVVPALTALVEPGMATSEIANLLHRRGGTPALVAASKVPPPDPARRFVLVAAGLKAIPAAAYEHATAGATVVIDGPPDAGWKVAKEEADRVTFTHGKGQIVAYRKRIVDPSEFALDMIDLVTHRRRAARLWNATSAIPLAVEGGLLHIIQYGSPLTEEIQVRVQGHYAKARLLRPEVAPVELKVARRGTMTEVFPSAIRRLGVIQFE